MTKTIWLDMDGTIADLYAVEDWLPMLRAYNPMPYAKAKPIPNMRVLARLLNNRQRQGYRLGIVSALSKASTPAYDAAVIEAKMTWLEKHLPSVHFDEIRFAPYDFIKNDVNNGADILFDDEERHLLIWTGEAYPAKQILDILRVSGRDW